MAHNFYYKATHGTSNRVFDALPHEHESNARNITDNIETKKKKIKTISDTTKDIEDRYYGESNKTYNNDSKYYDNSPPSDNYYMYGIVAALALLALRK